ncbi:MAG: DNA repair protein RecO [Candidatus Raymondbacteria bacterium RifOxyA12_full_50_37]|uniref:DNA repair protein RecO n=1 Tax=Candidatus Raymondbacteria bacterium RIFOXYD12_FULL_49_13 TaxID=1817890 RepID=A0A1F7FKC8_UNCRA|nr:MAG: DNA repair protein RecO [Candidatus Raymondbacteria bacterium RifOxyA12_full_50_37]OGJ90835.1 MAG: DNA repair protein RecO [Candidatus Raymondbacteria bacterium RIFOXYA2_FULL_49_16]OGJ98643.1 MAG: DNA repair protein RecO [Candidatus Raymondbacteria bacterium RIFOXYC2_FULL_50_21]OGK00405.1 MAG: DNA repair protein RecO [Candidatus Raymondbacteria bacterium RifOxyB12_full_50_8]OGK05243.1 MAG: DNA repair protein RecO [Candidatus Raymondbacteria bacterium RifOxyC12_full_50_8]OGK07083.1 MAG:
MEKTLAIVMGSVRFAETSKIVQLFTRQFGRMSVAAKGASRKGSPFAATLEPFSLCEFIISVKKGRDVQTLANATIVDHFGRIRESELLLPAAQVGIELLRKTVHEDEPLPQLFELLAAYLRRLNVSGEKDRTYVDKVIWMYMLYFLKVMGFAPIFNACISCGSITFGATAAVSPRAGGALCSSCGIAHTDSVWLPERTLGFLGSLLALPIDALEPVAIPNREVVGSVILSLLQAHFEQELVLNSLAFYNRV